MTGVRFCTTNFRNYHSLKDSSGPQSSGPSQTELHYVAKFRRHIPFQGLTGLPQEPCSARRCAAPSWVSSVPCVLLEPTRVSWGGPRPAKGVGASVLPWRWPPEPLSTGRGARVGQGGCRAGSG